MSIETTGVNARVSWMGTEYSITVGRYESAGIVGVFESVVPARCGPPIHVVDGEYEFWIDGRITRLSPGNSIFLPRGVPHTFRVVGERPGRNLTVLTPGGLENFFIEAASLELRIPVHMAEIAELGGRYGIEFIGPAPWSS
jgi:hypothetical protein